MTLYTVYVYGILYIGYLDKDLCYKLQSLCLIPDSLCLQKLVLGSYSLLTCISFQIHMSLSS